MRVDSPPPEGQEVVHLRAGGCSVVLVARGIGLPVLVHWGGDLGELSVDARARLVSARIPAVGRVTVSPGRSGIVGSG